MLVCTQCTNKDPCVSEANETKALFCETPDHQHIIRCEWHEYISGDDLYTDPMGKPYKDIDSLVQTPMSDPLKATVSKKKNPEYIYCE